MKVISLINNKGGVAKTTTTIHLGAYLAKRGYRVLMIDFDPQCNLTSRVNANELEYCIKDFLNKQSKNFRLKKNVDTELYTMKGDTELDVYDFKPESLKEVIEALKKDFDFILIDCPPRLLNEKILTPNEVAIIASDEIIIPVQADTASIEGVDKLLKSIRRIKSDYNPDLNVLGILFTCAFDNEVLFEFFYNKVNELSNGLVFKNYIRKNVEIQKAETKKKTIFTYNSSSTGAVDYSNFGKEVLKRIKNK